MFGSVIVPTNVNPCTFYQYSRSFYNATPPCEKLSHVYISKMVVLLVEDNNANKVIAHRVEKWISYVGIALMDTHF